MNGFLPGKPHRLIAACLLLCVSLSGCGLLGDDDSQVRIRIRNESDVRFSQVFVAFPEDEVNYGPLSADDASAYEAVSQSYRYAYVEVEAGGEEYVIQPIDYVGETPLEGGRYTYALRLRDGHLSLRLIEN